MNSKRMRQERLRSTIENEPFLTDEELAGRFSVSVQTIRLDRMALGIPELRERMRAVAISQQARLRSLRPEEVFGEIVDLHVGESGLSVWRAEQEHVISRSAVVRGHYIFAQANSLAVAIVDAEQALTAKATIRFLKTATVGAMMVAKARVLGERHGYVRVEVRTKVEREDVFLGEFLILRSVEEARGGALI